MQVVDPIVIVEVKPHVSALLGSVDHSHIAQTVIQSYYTMIEYGKKCIIAVLSDLASWYFFKYELTPKTRTSVLTPLVKIAWFKAHLLRDDQGGSDSRKKSAVSSWPFEELSD